MDNTLARHECIPSWLSTRGGLVPATPKFCWSICSWPCLPPAALSIWYKAASSGVLPAFCILHLPPRVFSIDIWHIPFYLKRGSWCRIYASIQLLQCITKHLHSEFAMIDLGDLHHFLGISVSGSSNSLFLSQRQCKLDLLHQAGMTKCVITMTMVDTQARLSTTDGALVAELNEYCSLASALQYLTLTHERLLLE